MNILFTHSYFYPLDNKQWKKQQPYPPLGTITAAAFLREQGHHVALFDTNLILNPALIEPQLNNQKPDILVIYDDGFNYLTKMCLTVMREAAFEMIRLAKKKGILVAVSSSDATDHNRLYIEAGADFILLGEAENTLLELCDKLEAGKDPSVVSGMVLKQNLTFIVPAKRPVMKKLDRIPMAAWDLVDMAAYKKIWMKGNGYFSLNLATTRGCPFKCNWCAKPIYGNRYNSRSPEHVVAEIKYLLKNYQPTHFWMCDDIFGLKPGWVQEFNKLVHENKLKFKYTIQSRVDLLLKEDTIDALAQSGAHEIWVGAESGSQKVLDAMDKGTTVEQIKEATHLLKKKGVRVAYFLQFGYPGETKEDIQLTTEMVLEMMPDNIGVSVSYPLPGTPFHERVKSELNEKANWKDSDDLDLMFKNTYSNEYYRKLQRYLHRMLRKKQGKLNAQKAIKNPKKLKLPEFRSIALYPYYQLTTRLDERSLAALETKN
ncbi:MAG: B12-binding domain-containing radical SAM protein [Flavobacteriales bacterium]|nr:B12-binding domain-containing radical SAM protein [Flavobacteriales bacterium]